MQFVAVATLDVCPKAPPELLSLSKELELKLIGDEERVRAGLVVTRELRKLFGERADPHRLAEGLSRLLPNYVRGVAPRVERCEVDGEEVDVVWVEPVSEEVFVHSHTFELLKYTRWEVEKKMNPIIVYILIAIIALFAICAFVPGAQNWPVCRELHEMWAVARPIIVYGIPVALALGLAALVLKAYA
jgi:hypothetical protein